MRPMLNSLTTWDPTVKHTRVPFIIAMLLLAALACQAVTPGSGDSVQVEQSPTLLFQDDFSSSASGWDRVRDEEGITDYESGAYRFLLLKPNWYFWSTPGLFFSDVRVEVDAVKLGGPDINEYGVICRNQDFDNFYFFTVSSDGYYGISKFKEGQETLIGMEALQYNEAILQGQATNHLRVDCVGSRLALYINGRILAEVQDGEFGSGDVGLIVGSFEEPGVEIQFDNFTVLRP
jgi:hypothetical protein